MNMSCCAVKANRYSISIRTELAEGLPKVMADRVQLQQVFMNLMLNGMDAMKETSGGSELTIRSEAGNGQLLISVSDTGRDCRQSRRTRSSRHSLRPRITGTGMGLAHQSVPSLSRMAAACGPPVPPGGATTFQFTLPATVAAHA